MLDGELWQWHLGLRVEWVGAMVVVALLQECVVCGLQGREAGVRGGGWAPVPGSECSDPQGAGEEWLTVLGG